MNAQQAENLRILIRHMETNVKRVLNMNRDYEICGAPACAMGEASTVAALRDAGIPRHCTVLAGGDFDGHHKVFGLRTCERWRLFGMDGCNAWSRADVTPQEWVIEARKVLAENGYSMDNGFAAFKAKILAPVPVEA